MNIYPFLHFFAFLVYLYLIIVILIKDPKSWLNRVCAAILACFALWSFAYIFIYNLNTSKDTAMLFGNISSIGWYSFASFFLWFCLLLTGQKKILKLKIFYLFIFILPLLFIYKQWTGFLIVDYSKVSYGWSMIMSESIWLYLYYLYYLSFTIGGLSLIFNLEKKTKELIKKKQAGIIFVTTLISLILGTLTEVALPELNIQTIPSLANVTTFIWASGIAYAIVKYKLMVITPAAAAEDIISTMADSLILLDGEGNIVTVNKATLDLSGYRKNELEGKSVDRLFAEKNFKSTLLDKVIRGEAIRNYELNFKTKSKDNIPVIFSSSIMRDETGGLAGIVCVVKDITERKKAEEALAQEHNLLQALIDNIPDSIYFKDDKNRFIRVNETKASHEGTTPQKMIGKTDFDFFPQEQAKESFADDNWVMKFNKALIDKIEKITHKDGTEYWFSVTKIPRHNERGEVIGTMGISRDISELKKTQEELERSNTELERFAYVASHDLQEPLRMVSSYLQLLERRYKGKFDSDADEFISYAVDGASRMQMMINDLLQYSRVSTKGRPFKSTDCESVLERALTNLKMTIEESRAVVTHTPLPKIMADDIQLVQLLQNLIANAIKFRGKKSPRIHLSVKREESRWVFSVKDNGIGIAPEYTERIFEIFQRLHSRKDYPGTGIGLAVCKRIVERHGGRIWIESQPDKGSTFYFTIPIREEKNGQ